MSAQRPDDTDPAKLPWLGRKLLFLDDLKNVERIVRWLFIVCGLLFVADFLYHKHTYVGVEKIPGFYALYGFFMCAALVICAKGMRVLLKRPEDYYAPEDVESEAYPDAGLGLEDIND